MDPRLAIVVVVAAAAVAVAVLLLRTRGVSTRPAPPPPPADPAPAPASRGIDSVKTQSGTSYNLLRVLGEGAMGQVYEGLQPQSHVRVAVKVLSGGTWTDGELRERFLREVTVCQTLQHPNVVKVLDWGLWNSADGRWKEVPFMVMELVSGDTLAKRQGSAAMSVTEATEWLVQALTGLQAAHTIGVVHRDIKPDNLMRTESGCVKLMDFGIAHLGEMRLTATGSTMGTPTYMSPEHMDARHVVPASDIYSLGVVIYEVLCGRPPFVDVPDMFTLAVRIMNEEVPPLRTLNPEVPDNLARVVERMLARSRDVRYASAQAVLDDLRS